MRAPVWVFDLDDTLHHATPHIFPQINRAMTAYIERHLALDHAAATALRQHYWQRYGATLLGLIRHHGIDPHHFLAETHQFENLSSMLITAPALADILRQLPGRRIIFSNAPRAYTLNVLRLTGLLPVFDAVYTVESFGFQPKPMRSGFLKLLRKERIRPAQAIMVEDSLANLVMAKRLGIHTLWVTRTLRNSPWVDHKLRSITDLRHLVDWSQRATCGAK
ncbi:MAG: pyrimidine 5'-nucleotidase [Fluviibacter sp.]